MKKNQETMSLQRQTMLVIVTVVLVQCFLFNIRRFNCGIVEGFVMIDNRSQATRRIIGSSKLNQNGANLRNDNRHLIVRMQSSRNNNNNKVDKGFNLLELASGIVPQGSIVTAVSESWKLAWKRMMIELAPQDTTGNYIRPKYTFNTNNIIIGSSSNSKYLDEPGRYHIYTGNPCPWCHRVVLCMKLLGYTSNQIGWTVLEDNPRQASRGGWIFAKSRPDRIFDNTRDLRELYNKLQPGYTGRCTAPLLVDTKTKTIISNESADIIRILNSITLGRVVLDRINLTPYELQEEIDTANEWIYRLLNNGVYRCGFATSQEAYNTAVADVIQGLQLCETILSISTYVCCNEQITESDVLLLPTLLRFDGVYNPLFIKGTICIRSDYPNIYRYLQQCWNQYPEIRTSIDIPDACTSYYKQLFPLNPGGILPLPVTAKTLGLE